MRRPRSSARGVTSSTRRSSRSSGSATRGCGESTTSWPRPSPTEPVPVPGTWTWPFGTVLCVAAESERQSAAEDFSAVELALATRNHGFPLESLRYDLTPIGLHYLLIHFDIPQVDGANWRLEIGGEVSRPLSFSLDELKERPRTSVVCTLECAGNGRARLSPRPLSQPWLEEAFCTAQWGGTPPCPLLQQPRLVETA